MENMNDKCQFTGQIDLSGMTWYEYTEWALQQENNVQPSKMDRKNEVF